MSISDVQTKKRASVPIPHRPHMHADQIRYLQDKFAHTKCFLEYGAGGSTKMAAELGIGRIFSVESDVKYSRQVIRSVLKDHPDLNLTMKTSDIGVTAAWGRPVNSDKFRNWPGYALDVWNEISKAGVSPDLVLIDGRFRVACFAASMIFCNEGVEILFDDYVGRERKYGAAAKLFEPTRIVEKMAVFRVPSDRPFRELSATLARFSCVYD